MGSWAVDLRESGRVLVYSRQGMNRRCKLCNVTPEYLIMLEDRNCLMTDYMMELC